jgi:hypothetical protein
MTRDQEIAWAAGLFEGEGYVYTQTQPRSATGDDRWAIQVGLNMNDLDVVEKFMEVFGFGKIRVYESANEKHHTNYRWRSTSWREFNQFADALYPLLGDRRRFLIDLARDRQPESTKERVPV